MFNQTQNESPTSVFNYGSITNVYVALEVFASLLSFTNVQDIPEAVFFVAHESEQTIKAKQFILIECGSKCMGLT